MTEVQYTIHAHGRVSAARSAEKLHHTAVHSVIPGTTVRGALAALWWLNASSNGGSGREFADLFDLRLRVGQAVPDGSRLISASSWVCKYQREPACQVFVVDAAVEFVQGAVQAELRCPGCGGPTQQKPGWNVPHGLVRTVRTALDADGTAKDGQLFARDSLPAGQVLTGRLRGVELAALSWAGDQPIRLGGKRSVMGGGRITLAASDGHVPALGEQTVLRLTSPAVILDAYGAATLAEDALEAELRRVSGEAVTVEWSWLRSELLTGWHMRSTLPKPRDWALAAGSTAVITGLTATGWDRLAMGIGHRTLEGYGAVETVAVPQVVAVSHRHDAVAQPDAVKPVKPGLADEVVTVFVEHQVTRQLPEVVSALRSVRKARDARYGQPERAVRNALRSPWARSLPPQPREALTRLLDQTDHLDALVHRLDLLTNGELRSSKGRP